MALALGGCEKIKTKLYPPDVAVIDQVWVRDSTTVAKGPAILFRTFRKGDTRLLIPIGTMQNSNITMLRMSKRGWNYLDIAALGTGSVTPIHDGQPAGAVKISQRMWENAATPLDSMDRCPNMIPHILAPMPSGSQLAVMNYPLPSGLKTMTEAQTSEALSKIPQLVTPTIGVRPAQLARYTRTVRQVLRKDAEPALLVEYHDDAVDSDTSTLGLRRPRHIVIVMEKGMYGYRPGWVYSTTGTTSDRPALRFLDSFDVDGDGKSELFFGVDVPNGWSYTLGFKAENGSWTEFWRRNSARCDV